jgi:hypothetical protein
LGTPTGFPMESPMSVPRLQPLGILTPTSVRKRKGDGDPKGEDLNLEGGGDSLKENPGTPRKSLRLATKLMEAKG